MTTLPMPDLFSKLRNSYFINRTIQMVITFGVVTTVAFLMFQILPGDPADYVRAQLEMQQTGTVTRDSLENQMMLYGSLGSNDPIYIQYIDYMIGLLQGNFGTSIMKNEPVLDVLAKGMPWTIFLSASALFISFIVSISWGALMAYTEASRFDSSSTGLALLTTSIPFYVVAILLLWWFGYELELLPTGLRYPETAADPKFTLSFVIGVLIHAILPLTAMVFHGLGGRALSMRANSIRILGQDYIRVARLRGLTDRRITMRYVGRNAILPMYTGLMMSIGGLFSGAVILEKIFNYRGLGYYTFEAFMARDWPLMMGGFLFITLGTLFGIYLADLTYGLVDPRIGRGGERDSF